MKISTGLIAVLATSALTAFGGQSKAGVSLSVAGVYAAECPSSYGYFCGYSDEIALQDVHHFGLPSTASVNPSPGTSAYASAGLNSTTQLPLLGANSATPAGTSIQAGSVGFGVQGFIWKGASGTMLPLVGEADFTIPTSYTFPSDPRGWAFVSGQIAVTDDSVRSPTARNLWLSENGHGEFNAGCGTTGALSVSNFGFDTSAGPGSFTVNASTGCGGSSLTLTHGEEFFVWSTLTAFAYRGGSADAASTFLVDLSPDLSATERAYILGNLSPASLVPEPPAWLLTFVTMTLAGAALRGRRRSQRLARA